MTEGRYYFILIDPLLRKLHEAVANRIPENKSVIDIACGNGTLAMKFAHRASQVTGIDLDSGKLMFARKLAARRGFNNIIFQKKDATDLSEFQDDTFDIATISMAIHQFDLQAGMHILSELERISGLIIIADYRIPLPDRFPSAIARLIERLAGKDHHRCFRQYLEFGGLPSITEVAFSGAEKTLVDTGSVFQLAIIQNFRHSRFS